MRGILSYRTFAVLILALILCRVPLSFAAPLTMPDSIPKNPGKAALALQTVLDDIGKQRAEVIAIQRELVARPALNPQDGGEGEEAKARWIEDYLLSKGLPPAERFDVPDERVPAKIRPNLIIRYPGASERTLWIVGHLDTSPPGDLSQWTGSPWALRIEGDTLYGRGVEDNHQAITSGLILMESLARNRVVPPLSLGLILTAGEKEGFPRKHGLDALLRAKPELFRLGDLVLLNDYGNTQGSLVEVAEKGLLWLKVSITGRQAHAAFPGNGVNALEAGAAFIMDLRSLYGRFPAENALFTPAASTFVPSKAESGGTPINQVPGEYAFHLDCRLLPPLTADEAQQAVREMADAAEKRDRVSITLERVMMTPAFPGTAPDAPVVQAVSRAVRTQFGVTPKPVGVGGATLAAELRSRGIPAVLWAKSESTGASPNEHISASALLDAAKIFARILFDQEAANATPPAAPENDETPANSANKP